MVFVTLAWGHCKVTAFLLYTTLTPQKDSLNNVKCILHPFMGRTGHMKHKRLFCLSM